LGIGFGFHDLSLRKLTGKGLFAVKIDVSTRIDEVARQCVDVLRNRPSGLFSDFDGTLSEIAPTPRDAVAAPGASEALARVAGLVDAAGIITGRAVADVRTKIDADDLIVVGNHGLEWLEHGQHVDHEAGTAAEQGITDALAEIERRLSDLMSTEHMVWENKRLTASIHYRNVNDPVSLGMTLLPIVEEEAIARGLRVSSGKMLVELRPSVIVSKGTALEQLVRTRSLNGAVFFGDDVTDVDGFTALNRLRESGSVRTLAVAIRSRDVHPSVIAEADVVLESVSETVEVLNQVAALLEQRD
jgi:trehalose 6-phosphate phosphatase